MKTALKVITASLLLASTALTAETTDPQLISGPQPDYPEVSRSQYVEGTVVVEALVDENGNVFAADVLQSVDPALDAATVKAVREWKFSSAMKDGKPVVKVVRIPVEFSLVDPMDKSVANAENGAIASR